MVKYYEIRICFLTNASAALCHAPSQLWNLDGAGFQRKQAPQLKRGTQINLPPLMSNEDKNISGSLILVTCVTSRTSRASQEFKSIIHWAQISFLIRRKVTVNFRNQRHWHHKCRLHNNRVKVTSNHAKVTGNHVVYDRGAWFLRIIMSSSLALFCLPSVNMKKHKHEFFLVRSMHNKTIIRFGFCDIQNNQGLGKGYQVRVTPDNPYPDLDYSGFHKNRI